MAVEDTTTEATTVAEDTSTNEEAQDTGVSLEDIEISFGDDDTEEAEDESEDSATTEDESKEESEEDGGESEDNTEDEAQDEEAPKKSEAENAEDLAKQAFEARKAERQARAEADQVRKQAEEANIDRYLREAADDETELARREIDVQNYRLKEKTIDLNNQALQTDLMRAVADIPLFKTGSDAVKNRLLRAVDQFEASYVVKDDKGRPLEIKGDIHQYLQQEANSIRDLLGDGAREQTKNKTNQKSRTLATPSKTPPSTKKTAYDDMLAGFDEEIARVR